MASETLNGQGSTHSVSTYIYNVEGQGLNEVLRTSCAESLRPRTPRATFRIFCNG